MDLDLALPDLPSDRLPLEIQEIIFDAHFNIGNKGQPFSIRLTPEMGNAMDVMLQRIREQGGVPWLNTWGDMMRMGTFLLLSLLKTALLSPPDTLNVILMSEAIQGKANTRKLLTEKMRQAIDLTADQVHELRKDPNARGEMKKLLTELILDIEQIKSVYWRNKWKQVIMDNLSLRNCIQELGMEKEFEVDA